MTRSWNSIACGSVLLIAFAATAVAERVEPVLWHHPGRIEALDFYGGPGGRRGAPQPPFRYVASDNSGTSFKILVRDRRNRIWDVKWGDEVRPEAFATRLAWALGYYAEPTYFVRQGRILGAHKIGWSRGFIKKHGRFQDARFELRDPTMKFRKDVAWTWNKNPFSGSHELSGLKILVMLLSDWDNKDAREGDGNTGVMEDLHGGRRRWIYFVNDWGAAMGRWGGYFTREKWDCDEYAKQTPKFVKAVAANDIEWGFKGKHTSTFKDGITVADVRWLMQYLGRVSDAQLRAALRASGADANETRCFSRSLRSRIEQLRGLRPGTYGVMTAQKRTARRLAIAR